MTTTLEGQTVVIFGGTSGIGFAVAKAALLSCAAKVIIASSNQANVDDAIVRLRVAGKDIVGEVTGAAVDAKDLRSVEEFVDNLGEIDHLVWTSGDRHRPGLKDVDLETLKDMYDVRFWGPIAAARKAQIRAGGSITLTTGLVLYKPVKGWSISAGVAGAVDSMARGLALDLEPVRVNVICPGIVRTKMYEGFAPEVTKELFALGDKLLVKHIATADEVAEAYLFAMKCTYLTGERIDVDGGHKFI